MTTRAPEDSLLRAVTTALQNAGIPFMLTGSLASAFYGAGRATMGIDLVVDPTVDQLRRFVDALRPDRFYASLDAALEARRHESLFNVVDSESGWKVDLIVRKSRPSARSNVSAASLLSSKADRWRSRRRRT